MQRNRVVAPGETLGLSSRVYCWYVGMQYCFSTYSGDTHHFVRQCKETIDIRCTDKMVVIFTYVLVCFCSLSLSYVPACMLLRLRLSSRVCSGPDPWLLVTSGIWVWRYGWPLLLSAPIRAGTAGAKVRRKRPVARFNRTLSTFRAYFCVVKY